MTSELPASTPSEPFDLPDEIIGETVPDDDIVLAYITHGALPRYVEGVAGLNAEFYEELEAMIDSLIQAGEPISDTAHAWRMAGLEEPQEPPPPDHHEEEAHLAPVIEIAPRRVRPTTVYVLLAVAAGFLLLIGGGSFAHQREEADRIQAAKEQHVLKKQAELDHLMHQLAAEQQDLAVAQTELSQAQNDADRVAAQAKLQTAEAQTQASKARIYAVKSAAGAGSANTKPACKCSAGDPLCSCL